jgi:type IV pilus assembly protein PilV
MIEALVALLILVLGVLGIARLQIFSLMEARNANARSVAAQAASDLLDRMQINRAARFTVNPFSDYVTGWNMPGTPATNCVGSPCTPTALAAHDIWQWKQSLALQLPSGDATVFRSDTDPTQLGVLIAWAAIEAKNFALADAANTLLYTAADAVVDATGNIGTGLGTVNCPAQRICHLVYLRP